MSRLTCASILASLVSSAGVAAQQVWVVDAGTGGSAALQNTVDDPRVQPGDILRVRPGVYSPTTINSKPLHILAEGTVEVQQLVIQGIPAQATLSLYGLLISGVPATGSATPSFVVRQCVGGVVAVLCQFRGRQEAPSSAPQMRAVVQVDHAALFAEWCVFSGTFGAGPIALPGAALRADNATVTLTLCRLNGGSGASPSAQDGMPAIAAAGSVVYLEHNFVFGGNGGTPGAISCPGNPGGAGGAAVEVADSDLLVTGAEQLWAGSSPQPICGRPTSAIAGTGNVILHPNTFLRPNPGAPGLDQRLSVHYQNPVALVPQQASLLPGQRATWDHYGEPGSFVFTLLSPLAWTTVPHPTLPGGLHVDFTLAIVNGPLVVPPSGSVPIQFQIPNSPELLGARLFVATIGMDARLQNVLATPPSSLFVRFL